MEEKRKKVVAQWSRSDFKVPTWSVELITIKTIA
ncbi:hypothetical protein NPIL_291801, partial [Nephila pilipes]